MGVKGEKTRENIIKTARHLFRHQGYKNTTIEDISAASGVQRGNLYFYFQSKEELAQAVIEDARQKEFPFIQKIMGEEADPLIKIERMMEGMAKYILKEQCQGG